jgi:4-hydroxy-tetrahydrodipicolinate reductase
MTVGIGIVGACGRMGLEIATAAAAQNDVRVVAALEQPGADGVGKDIGEMIHRGPMNVIVGTDLDEAVRAADVVVDLSLPSSTTAVIDACVTAKTPLLCGTTGVSEDILARFDSAARTIPVVYASNLSPGITLLTSLIAQAARALSDGYDIEIIEMHHRNKVDAPSGTALTLAEAAASARGLSLKDAIVHGRAGHTGVRRGDEIGMHAVRGGGVFGDHTVILASQNERIEITHRASSRALFAEGAVKAARFLAKQPPGRYTMKDALGM